MGFPGLPPFDARPKHGCVGTGEAEIQIDGHVFSGGEVYGFVVPAPEELLRIARRFNAGIAVRMTASPGGTTEPVTSIVPSGLVLAPT